MNRHFAILAVLVVVLPVSVLACPADGKHEPPKPFDQKTTGALVDQKTLTPIEKLLNAIMVPEIDFRCASIYDIIVFYDECRIKDNTVIVYKPDQTICPRCRQLHRS